MYKQQKNKIYTILIIAFSIICGIISKDYFLGTIILESGLLNSYYASVGKIYNYIFNLPNKRFRILFK